MLSKTKNRSASGKFNVTIAAKPLRLHDVTMPRAVGQGRVGLKPLSAIGNLKPARVSSAAHT